MKISIPIVGCLAAFVVTKNNVSNFYRDFVRLTKDPHRVAPLTGILCRVPTPTDYEREKEATGPHYHWSVHLYANPTAMKAVTNRMDTFPEGSIIVKEKLRNTNRVAGGGGMIKRAPGYDSENGD